MEQHSISELLKSYRVEIFGVAVAFVVVVIFRFFFIGGAKSNNKVNKPSTETSSKSETDEIVKVNLNDLKEAEPTQIDIGETSAIVVVKDKTELYAFGSKCSHLGAPLKNGFYMNGRIRCPWHGACFSTKTGDIEDFPCVDGIHCFQTTINGNSATIKVPKVKLVNNKRQIPMPFDKTSSDKRTFVVIGAGPAGQTAVESLRQKGFSGKIVLVGREKHFPYDRTKLSKNMDTTVDKILLRPANFFDEIKVDVKLGISVTSVNPSSKKIELSDKSTLQYDKLLICTGGDPRSLPVPGSNLQNIFPLRVPEDSQNIIKNVEGKRVVIVGTSFIGMEAASCIAKKAKSVIAIGMESVPFERVLGKEIGTQLQKFFESNGVNFRLKKVVKEFIGEKVVSEVVLDDGEHLPADICILGAGIIPTTNFLSPKDFTMEPDKSVVANEYLQAKEDIYVAGDIARFPFWLTNRLIRVEHYAFAQYQGRIAAHNMLGLKEPVKSVPFFWTNIFGKRFTYAGHALEFDDFVVDGSIENFKFVAYYIHKNKVVAVVSVGREQTSAKAAEFLQANIMPSGEEIKNGKFL